MKSLEELNILYKKMKQELSLRSEQFVDTCNDNKSTYRTHVLVCGGTGCTSSGCKQILLTLQKELEKHNLTNEISVIQTGCHGLCALGPIMIVYPEGTFYSMVKPEYISEIVEEHFVKGNVVTKYIYKETKRKPMILPVLMDV